MKKILGLFILAATLVATSCEKYNNESAAGSRPNFITIIDSDGNNVLENDPKAIYDVEIIYKGETFVFEDNTYHGTMNDVEIWYYDYLPGAFKIYGYILSWGTTTDFTLKFRGQSFDVSIVATDDYKNVSPKYWHTATVNGKPCEQIGVDMDVEKVYEAGFTIENNPTEAHILAFPIYLE